MNPWRKLKAFNAHELVCYGRVLVIAFSLIGLSACEKAGVPNSGKLPSDAEFQISERNCHWEQCTGKSMRVYGDGSFEIQDIHCPNSQPCKGAMKPEEVNYLFQTIEMFGFVAFAASPVACQDREIWATSVKLHLQMDGKESEVTHSAPCGTSKSESKLDKFESDIRTILAFDQRIKEAQIAAYGNRGASIANIEECKPSPMLKQEAKADNYGTVGLKFELDQSGKLVSVSVVKSSGYASLDKAALIALSRCKFSPAYRNGEPIPSSFATDFVWDEVD